MKVWRCLEANMERVKVTLKVKAQSLAQCIPNIDKDKVNVFFTFWLHIIIIIISLNHSNFKKQNI